MYRFKIKCTFRYYGYPQAERHYEISSNYLDANLKWYGCNGFDLLDVTNKHHLCNGYFGSFRALVDKLYGAKEDLRNLLRTLQEGETIQFDIE